MFDRFYICPDHNGVEKETVLRMPCRLDTLYFLYIYDSNFTHNISVFVRRINLHFSLKSIMWGIGVGNGGIL